MSATGHTNYRPGKALLLWDGACGFCRYWVTRWQYLTKDRVSYVPYQERSEELREIPAEYFKEAVRLIDTEGKIYTGADAVYHTLHFNSRYRFLLIWYDKFAIFRRISEKVYSMVSHNRPLLFKISILLFGRDPLRLHSYWLFYLLGLIFLILALSPLG